MRFRLLAILTIVCGTILGVPTAALADGVGHDAVLQNQSYSYYTITVCHNAASDTSCVPGSYGFLSPGQNTKSKYGWADADGMWCPKGWWCEIFHNTFRGSGSGWGSRFIKIGGCFGCTVPIYVYPDRG
jgi:hypothetical protein